jgi:hypothetical protein
MTRWNLPRFSKLKRVLAGGNSEKQTSDREGDADQRGRPDQRETFETPDDSLGRHVYEALSGTDKIRVLKLHVGSRDSIDCSLEQISYADGGYHALSYVWGKEEKPFRAIVRGDNGEALGYIPLTENLASALRNLRDTSEIEERVFWIDQICIDQEGVEKNHQVKLMGNIYRTAMSVITYIGPAVDNDGEEQRGIRLLEQLDSHFSPNYDIMFRLGELANIKNRVSELAVRELPSGLNKGAHGGSWRWLASVVCGEWAERLWMVQEQLLNSNTIMLRGNRLLPWGSVASMTILFYLNILPRSIARDLLDYQQRKSGEAGGLSSIAANVYGLWWYRRKADRTQAWGSSETQMRITTLVSLIVQFGELDCHDPRDRVFALLALSTDARQLAIEPDYSAENTLALHYRNYTARVLLTANNLEPLVLACRWQNSSDSNVPSWAITVPRAHYQAPSYVDPEVTRPAAKAHPYGSFRVAPRFEHARNILILKGRQVDQISLTAPLNTYTRSMAYHDEDENFIRGWEGFISSCSSMLDHAGITLENASSFCRALMGEFDLNGSKKLNQASSRNEDFVFALCCLLSYRLRDIIAVQDKISLEPRMPLEEHYLFLRSLAATCMEPKKLHAWDPAASQTSQEYALLHAFNGCIMRRGRTFCFTEQERFCNAMNEAEIGDKIFALEGDSDRLFILRPVGKQYRVIGDAWVDGLMQGQAYEGLDPDEVDYDIEII